MHAAERRADAEQSLDEVDARVEISAAEENVIERARNGRGLARAGSQRKRRSGGEDGAA
jgi:hypothetical protein